MRGVRERGARDAAHLVDLGMALERVGEPAQAEACYREALARGAGGAVALNNLAWLLLADPSPERRAEGLERAREAVRLAPGAAEALDTLGWAHHLLGRSHEALPLLERASARLFGQPTVRFHLAVVLEALGRRDAARAALEVALRLPPGWPEEAEARERLAALAGPG
ncbi:MAG: tetratricopeptide repeat protein [Planctomycetes bacterium]|nr:tetratricopeptide repeat protein [Planctomycetota bacterium]